MDLTQHRLSRVPLFTQMVPSDMLVPGHLPGFPVIARLSVLPRFWVRLFRLRAQGPGLVNVLLAPPPQQLVHDLRICGANAFARLAAKNVHQSCLLALNRLRS